MIVVRLQPACERIRKLDKLELVFRELIAFQLALHVLHNNLSHLCQFLLFASSESLTKGNAFVGLWDKLFGSVTNEEFLLNKVVKIASLLKTSHVELKESLQIARLNYISTLDALSLLE
jgi:hypothetical protein